ncbi:hypothetical protein TNCV_1506071 [Trichonephila clavipes]|nr:hypothetical protein TNCV_1506071 [Trichonephila clavipes]
MLKIFPLQELWEIDSSGIRDPIENVSKRKLFDEQLKEFHEELTVLPDGRCELPGGEERLVQVLKELLRRSLGR